MNEQELILKSQNGDDESFSNLILPYERKMINYAYRMLGNEEDASDAVQETMIRVWKSIGSFRGKSSFSTWLYTVLNNVCLDLLRKKKRRGDHMNLSINQSDENDDEYELQVEDTSPGPFDNYRKKMAAEVLEKALSELSPEHRTVIVMRDIHGFEYEEIAKATGLSLGTVKSRINRGRLYLRKILEENRELFL